MGFGGLSNAGFPSKARRYAVFAIQSMDSVALLRVILRVSNNLMSWRHFCMLSVHGSDLSTDEMVILEGPQTRIVPVGHRPRPFF